MLDLDALADQTGRPVRTDYHSADRLPRADAVIAAPATYNTINTWAAGIADTYPLTLLAELTGIALPIVVLPFVNSALAANRVFTRNIEDLQTAGVQVLFGPGQFEPHPPGVHAVRTACCRNYRVCVASTCHFATVMDRSHLSPSPAFVEFTLSSDQVLG